MASIKKAKNGTYNVTIYVGTNPTTGRRSVTTRRGFRTQKEAKLIAAEIEQKVADKTYWNTDNNDYRYRDLYEIWIKTYEQTVASSTFNKTKTMFKNHFLKKFGDTKVSDMTPARLQDYATELAQKYKRADTMFNYFVLPISHAYKLELIDKNPAARVDAIKSNRKSSKENNFYESWQLALFLKISKQLSDTNFKQYAFFRLLAMTGMRKQEICALTWKDIDFKQKLLSITKAVSVDKNKKLYISNKTKTLASTRTISLDNETLDVLKMYQAYQKNQFENWNVNFLVFGADRRNLDGKRILSMNTARRWKEQIQDLMDAEHGSKIEHITVHGFRHTHISLLAESGAKLKAIQARVGHADARMTLNIYAHATKSSKDELTAILPNLLEKSAEKE